MLAQFVNDLTSTREVGKSIFLYPEDDCYFGRDKK